jgi:DNA polymerase delta subunit 4
MGAFRQRKPAVRPLSGKPSGPLTTHAGKPVTAPTSPTRAAAKKRAEAAVASAAAAAAPQTAGAWGGRNTAVGTDSQLTWPPPLADDAAEKRLRDFDLDMRFGPCLGVTRLQRWERAHANGLDPPPEVKQLIEAAASNPARKENLWRQWRDLL